MVRARALATLGAVAALAACDLGSTEIPTTTPMLVVHSVLGAGSRTTGFERTQLVLVEESLTGSMAVVDSGPYDPSNPIVSGNGIPVAGAVVQLTYPDGRVLNAVEVRPTGRTTGIYQFALDTLSLILPGERYHLSVSHGGRTVTGTTLVPNARPTESVGMSSFNRDRDTIRLDIPEVDLARAYWIKIEAPASPFTLFTQDRDVKITGDTRNFFTESLIKVFYPGFHQALTVAAIDSNLYDYYRTGSDPFTGAGLINRLEGGIGVFGSVTVIDRRSYLVTQDPTGDPIEGEYTRRGGNPASPSSIRLYLESKSANDDGPDRLSGTYVRQGQRGVYGTRTGDSFDLALLDGFATGGVDTYFRGTIRGDTLRGSFTSGGLGVYVKVP